MSNEIRFNVGVVLPASGTGERMGMCQPKQFSLVMGRPLIVFTISTFHSISWIEYIVITVSEAYKELMEQIVAEYNFKKVTIVTGGLTRHRSIYSGVKAVANVCSSPDVVLIHDAVRIFAEEDLVRDLALSAHQHGAAGVSRPLVSSVIATDSDGNLTESLDRNQYVASEMPQAFKYNVIREAYEKSTEFDFEHGTECLLLAKKHCGVNANIVPGTPHLWKVTHRKDLYTAEAMLKESLLKVRLGRDALVDPGKITDEIEKELLTRLSPHQVSPDQDLGEVKPTNTFICVGYESLDYLEEICLPGPWTKQKPLIDWCYVSVIVVEKKELSRYHSRLCKQWKEMADNVRGQYTVGYAILTTEPSNAGDIATLVKQLVFERNPAMSGQVFLM